MAGRRTIPVLVGPFPDPVHGVSIINAKLAAEMTARGIAVRRIDLSPGRWSRGPAYHVTRAARTFWGGLRILAGAFGRRRYIMSVDGGSGLLYNIVLALAARATGQPVLLYHHSTRYVLADSALMRVLLAVTGRGAPHVFCSQKMAALFFARYGIAGSVIIVNNAAWVDPPALGPAPGLTPGKDSARRFRLGFLSTLTLEKGLGRAIDTLRLARERGLDAELVLAGALTQGSEQELVRQGEAEFGDALVYRGILGGTEKAGFYGALDLFLFPSLYPHETQSLVVPEALAAGTPVAAYDHHFVSEILGEGGLLVTPTESFADRTVAWSEAGGAAWPARRSAARRQFETERARAAGQVDRLVAWANNHPA